MQITPALSAGPSTNLGTGPIQPLIDLAQTTTTTLKGGFAYQPGLAESRMTVFPDKEGVVEFEVPFHATGHMCPTNYGQNTPTASRSIFAPFPTVTVTGTYRVNGGITANPSLAGCSIDVFRAVGDDFSFGGLLGCPQAALWYSAVNPV